MCVSAQPARGATCKPRIFPRTSSGAAERVARGGQPPRLIDRRPTPGPADTATSSQDGGTQVHERRREIAARLRPPLELTHIPARLDLRLPLTVILLCLPCREHLAVGGNVVRPDKQVLGLHPGRVAEVEPLALTRPRTRRSTSSPSCHLRRAHGPSRSSPGRFSVPAEHVDRSYRPRCAIGGPRISRPKPPRRGPAGSRRRDHPAATRGARPGGRQRRSTAQSPHHDPRLAVVAKPMRVSRSKPELSARPISASRDRSRSCSE